MNMQAIALCAFAAASAHAGIKYWDNPAFRAYDADACVQEGLVLNFDGIRNAGLAVDHDPDATTWVNLAPTNRYDLALSKSGTAAAWTDHGFDFKALTTFASREPFTFTTSYTVQVLADASRPLSDASANFQYLYFPYGKYGSGTDEDCWRMFALEARGGAASNPKNSIRIRSPKFYNYATIADGSFDGYATVVMTPEKVSFFGGTTIGNSVNVQSGLTAPEWTVSANWALGGSAGSAGNSVASGFDGVIKSYRHYSRALTEVELAWNRAIDDYRYFDAPMPSIPATNAIIRSSIPSLSGAEPCGAYAVDASGHVFTAPASLTANRRAYACTGHSVETWDAATGDWGPSVLRSGVLSVPVSSADLVRITWLFAPGDGIVSYDVNDYVQRGLVLHYDGIRNAGGSAGHDPAAVTWANLGSGGAAYDIARQLHGSGTTWTASDAAGVWTNGSGFFFDGSARMNTATPLALTNFTVQVVCDIDRDAETQMANIAYLLYGMGSGAWKYFGIATRPSTGRGNGMYAILDWWFTDLTAGGATRPSVNDNPVRYFTEILDVETAHVFSSTSLPSSGNGYQSGRGVTGPVTISGFNIGANHSTSANQALVGTVNAFRFYDRPLSAAELAQNRKVDDFRFHGLLHTTNVVVAVAKDHDFSTDPAAGAYEVSGSATFTASAGRDTPTGYKLESWDAVAGAWTHGRYFDSTSYTYDAATSPATVRLTWCRTEAFILVVR